MRPSVAIISVTVIDGGGLPQATELLQGMPVIWVAAASRERDSRTYPPEYLHVLPYDFTRAELRTMVAKLVRQLRARDAAPQPLDELVAHSGGDEVAAGRGQCLRGLRPQRAGARRNRRGQGTHRAATAPGPPDTTARARSWR